MTLDDVITMLLAEAMRGDALLIDAPWPELWRLGRDARARALRAGWRYRR